MEATPPGDDVPEYAQRPPIATAPLSVILLARTVSEAADALAAWKSYLGTLNRPTELLVLGSSTTGEVPDALHSEARWFNEDPARGFGPAVEEALHVAQHPLIAMAPADAQFQPGELHRLFAMIDQVDLAVGCRTVARRPWWIRWPGRVLGFIGWLLLGLTFPPTGCTPGATPWRRQWVVRWAFGLRLLDPESPLRLMRKQAVARIPLQSRGPFALVEQLAKANHLELILTEEPVTWSPPATPPGESVPFSREARELLRHPDFGAKERHLLAPPSPVEPVQQAPTEPPAPSS
jgi:hypothetical protein